MGREVPSDQLASIINVCEILGHPLPVRARAGEAPSKYLGPRAFPANAEKIKKLLGDRLPEDLKNDPEEYDKVVRHFRGNYNKCEGEGLVRNNTNFCVYLCDWFFFARNMELTSKDYFQYHLWKKDMDFRRSILVQNYVRRLRIAARGSLVRVPELRYKDKFYEYMGDRLHRECYVINKSSSREDFDGFMSRHEKFFIKPLNLSMGRGTGIVEAGSEEAEELWGNREENPIGCEELIVQHPDIARLNPSSVNSIRIGSLRDLHGNVHIMAATLRMGRKDQIIDNAHAGGVFASVDVETGKLGYTHNNHGLWAEAHPDSGVKTVGYQLPEWPRVREAVIELSKDFPTHYAGWDVSVLEDGSIEFIEGNDNPGLSVFQVGKPWGLRELYEPLVREYEIANNIPEPEPYNQPDPVISEKRIKRRALWFKFFS